ncbi:MAG: prenyltransferase/squalene oxidase repeat-containing protein [Pirellulaceae bacterium]
MLIAVTWGEPSKAQQASVDPALSARDVSGATSRAIDYLLTRQRDDGAITERGHETAMTSLAILAMASVGHQPGEPTAQGESMAKALDFVLGEDRQDDSGYFGKADGSRMYGHGIATLMLTEMMGMGANQQQDERIVQRLIPALELILASQKHAKRPPYAGGWRYTPTASDADLSVSIWQLLALRSAKNDDVQVPTAAIDDALEYLRRSYASPVDPNGVPADDKTGFSYTPGQRHATYTMTAAGVLAMQVCGQGDSPLAKGAMGWLSEHPPKWGERWFFYGTYYYAQAMQGSDDSLRQHARRAVTEILLEKQAADGSWKGQGEEARYGHVYATALAVLSLSVRHHYLPIYQR